MRTNQRTHPFNKSMLFIFASGNLFFHFLETNETSESSESGAVLAGNSLQGGVVPKIKGKF